MATFCRQQFATDKVERQTRIRNMAASLIEMFGDAAFQVAHGQSANRDVGGDCGIVWCELADAIGLILTSEGRSCTSPTRAREYRPSDAEGRILFETSSAKRAMRIRHSLNVRRSECFGSHVL